MTRVAAEFMSQILTEDRREQRVKSCREIKNQIRILLVCLKLLLVMNHGVMEDNISLKPNNNQANGRHYYGLDWKNSAS